MQIPLFIITKMLQLIRDIKLKFILYTLITVTSCTVLLLQIYFKSNLNAPYSDHPIILWWTPFMWENERIINCYNNRFTCLLTKNRTYENDKNLGAFLFYASQLEPLPTPLPPKNKVWAIFHEESPKNLAWFLYNETQNLFDITATFSRYSHFPVTLQYLENLNQIFDQKHYKSVSEKNAYLNELSPVLYLQSDCDTPINRDNYVKELMNYVQIDSFGKCLNNKKLPPEISHLYSLDLYNEELLEFISKYKFVLAFENAICNDYITEKLWRPLIVGSIPIYLGSPTVEDWLPNYNQSAILAKNFTNPKLLAKYVNEINANDNLYNSFLEHKIKKLVRNNLLKNQLSKGIFGLETDQEHPIPAFECFICKQLHLSTYEKLKKPNQSIYDCPKPSNEDNSWKNYWEMGEFQAKVLKHFIDNQINFSNETFEEEWTKLYENHLNIL